MILSGDPSPAEVPGGKSAPGQSRYGGAQGTIGKGGRRIWLYPREVTGTFTRRRRAVAWALLILYLGLPWISWNGEPLFLLDVFGRKAVIAGRYFWVQDLPLFLPAILGSGLLVFLVTARFGRVWCGWACPQTVFLQFLFAPVERLVEGRASRRRERDRHPFTLDWIGRKTAKHLVFAGMSAFIANTALAYFWGMHNLLYAMRNPSPQNAMGLGFVLAFSVVFYWVFACFREQACILVCPYARLQSVLVDESTSTVAYDQARGEPRGRGLRNVPNGQGGEAGAGLKDLGGMDRLGDCVDCNQCVLVCPTGIDIRMGSQLECLGCTRCMDACDRTMEARKLKPGLIRYASLAELRGERPDKVPVRLLVYGFLTLLLFGVSGAMLARRSALGLDLVRRGTSPYALPEKDRVANSFTLHIRNRQTFHRTLSLEIIPAVPAAGSPQPPGAPRAASASRRPILVDWQGRRFTISGGQMLTLPLEATIPASLFQTGIRAGRLDALLVVTGEGIRESIPITLAGPWRKSG